MTLLVTRLSGADIVLGTTFLTDNGIALDFGKKMVIFPEVSGSSTGKSSEDSRGSKMKPYPSNRTKATGPNAISGDSHRGEEGVVVAASSNSRNIQLPASSPRSTCRGDRTGSTGDGEDPLRP